VTKSIATPTKAGVWTTTTTTTPIMSRAQNYILHMLKVKVNCFRDRSKIIDEKGVARNTNLLVGGSIIVPSTSCQTGFLLAIVYVNKYFSNEQIKLTF